jgi:hypothetical protein
MRALPRPSWARSASFRSLRSIRSVFNQGVEHGPFVGIHPTVRLLKQIGSESPQVSEALKVDQGCYAYLERSYEDFIPESYVGRAEPLDPYPRRIGTAGMSCNVLPIALQGLEVMMCRQLS